MIEYMEYVGGLSYEQEPDYTRLRTLLTSGMKKEKIKLDGKLEFPSPSAVSVISV